MQRHLCYVMQSTFRVPLLRSCVSLESSHSHGSRLPVAIDPTGRNRNWTFGHTDLAFEGMAGSLRAGEAPLGGGHRGPGRSPLPARRGAFGAPARARCADPGADGGAASLFVSNSLSAPSGPLEARCCTRRVNALESVSSREVAELTI